MEAEEQCIARSLCCSSPLTPGNIPKSQVLLSDIWSNLLCRVSWQLSIIQQIYILKIFTLAPGELVSNFGEDGGSYLRGAIEWEGRGNSFIFSQIVAWHDHFLIHHLCVNNGISCFVKIKHLNDCKNRLDKIDKIRWKLYIPYWGVANLRTYGNYSWEIRIHLQLRKLKFVNSQTKIQRVLC